MTYELERIEYSYIMPEQPIQGSEILPTYYCNIAMWGFILNAAQAGGWEAPGTKHPVYAEWDGDYTTNDGQIVTADDVEKMCAAIRKFVSAHKSTIIEIKLRWAKEFIDFCKGCKNGLIIR